MDHRLKIRALLRTFLVAVGDVEPFADDESLRQSGRLDSLSVVGMISSLETDLGYDLSRVSFDPNTLDSVDGVLGVIEQCERFRT